MSKKVAITGSAASGKSLVLEYFGEFGARIEDADRIAHMVLENMKDKIKEAFGEGVLSGDRINRRELGKRVFTSKVDLEKLYKIIGKGILEEMLKILSSLREDEILAMEVPLLYEYSLENLFDVVVFVKADRELRFKRFKEKTGYEDKIIEKIFELQLPDEIKEMRANYTIENNGTKEELKKKAKAVFDLIRKDP